MPKSQLWKPEKPTLLSNVGSTHVKVNQLSIILCVVEDQGRDLIKEKKLLEKEKSQLASKAKKLKK